RSHSRPKPNLSPVRSSRPMMRPGEVRNIRWELSVRQEDTGAAVYFFFTRSGNGPTVKLVIPEGFLSADQEHRMLTDLTALHDPVAITPSRYE
ncbi:hypothetical protein, partial [Gordonia paraffinivorans]|uniref:hypothetical protein n=1 Tax=Gordonia paraffinivorans TaxID=175628 RepID=UPI001E50D1D5